MSLLADTLRKQFDLEEEDAFGLQDEYYRLNPVMEENEQAEDVGDEELEEEKVSADDEISYDQGHAKRTISTSGEHEIENHPANREFAHDDDDGEENHYPFIDVYNEVRNDTECEEENDLELEESCEFDYVGLATPRRAATVDHEDEQDVDKLDALSCHSSDPVDDSIRESLVQEPIPAESDPAQVARVREEASSEAQSEASSPQASPPKGIVKRSAYHTEAMGASVEPAAQPSDADKENLPVEDEHRTILPFSSSPKKGVTFGAQLPEILTTPSLNLPSSPSKAPQGDHTAQESSEEPAPCTPPRKPRACTRARRFVQKVHASPDKHSPPDSPLSPVTPGKKERFGGGYFTEGSDFGVDAYLRVCYEMRTAPITKITNNAATLTSIDLEHRGVGNRGCVALATFMRLNPNISSVNLGDNNLSSEGVSALMDAVAVSTSVQELFLAGNNLAGCMPLLSSLLADGHGLTVLDVSSCKIGDEGVSVLADAIQGSSALQDLRLDQNQISDSGFGSLCSKLGGNTSLRSLSVQWNGIRSTAPVAALLPQTTIATLDMTWNKIGTAGCITLAKALASDVSPSLRQLNVSHNEIGVEACKPMARALQQNSRMQRLWLSGNLIGSDGAVMLLSGLGPTSAMLRLDLKGCGLGERAGLPLEVLAAGPRTPWENADNVLELRRRCPGLLGTLAPREKPTPTKKQPLSGPREWIGVRNVPQPRAAPLKKSSSWKPGGAAGSTRAGAGTAVTALARNRRPP